MTEFEDNLKKMQWQRDLAMRGHERKGMSPELSEALRNEIRTALEAGGGAFDVNVARRVYDLAIAARDMCVVASNSVKEAIDQIKDTNGPMESLDSPDAPESQLQASETFGARLLRELMAVVPSLMRSRDGDDPKALVHALAEARKNGMHDVAEELERKLFGRVLSGPRPIAVVGVEAPEGSFDHGFADGKINAPIAYTSVDYNEGYKAGTTARFIGGVTPLPSLGVPPRDPPLDPPLCEACKKDQDPRGGSACHDCREIARASVGVTAVAQVRDHGGRPFELKMQGCLDDLCVYLCGCGLPIRQFEKEAIDCAHRPAALVIIGYESAAGSLAPAGLIPAIANGASPP